ncbi:hypothetical protein ACFQ0K_02450 [Nocardioides caeni]|nr:hypothetical protein [Nocardioides caeni]
MTKDAKRMPGGSREPQFSSRALLVGGFIALLVVVLLVFVLIGSSIL